MIMPRFRPGLWPSIAAIVAIAATILLGNWQHRRANFKADLQTQAAVASTEPILELTSAREIDPSMRYRPVVSEGAFVASAQIWLDNRTRNGVPGYLVLAPLRLADGTHVLVNRGWIAGTKTRDSVPAAPVPVDPVRVTGRLNTSPPSFLALSGANVSGAVWQNVDLADYARIQKIDVAPLIVEQWQLDVSGDGLVREWPMSDFGRNTNISYMWQWWGFATVAFVLWIVLGFRAGRVAASGIARNKVDGSNDG